MQSKVLDQPRTADAAFSGLMLEGETLEVTFNDWQEKPCALRFEGTWTHRWSPSASLQLPRDDCGYELFDSALLAQAPSSRPYRHYCIGFNTRDEYLEVIAINMTTSREAA